MNGWRRPGRWARIGLLLLIPVAILDWIALAPESAVVAAFAVATAGLAGIAAAIAVATLRRSRVLAGFVGVLLVLAGLALFGLNPVPTEFAAIQSWWPDTITQPQLVGSAYWEVLALGVELSGVGTLAGLLIVSLAGGRDRHR